MNYDLHSNELLTIMAYEGERLFADRLTTEDQRKKFKRLLVDEMAKLGPEDFF